MPRKNRLKKKHKKNKSSLPDYSIQNNSAINVKLSSNPASEGLLKWINNVSKEFVLTGNSMQEQTILLLRNKGISELPEDIQIMNKLIILNLQGNSLNC